MHRRELVRLLGGVSVIAGLSPGDLLALGLRTHTQVGLERTSLGFFDTHQMHTVAAAGDRIIPATDTPGAMAAHCHLFAERIVAHHYDATRQQRYLRGLIDLDQRASREHRQLFVQSTDEQQDAVLRAVEADAYAASTDGAESFWRDLKYLTLFGYYTSQIGIEQELKVQHPGRFEGSAPIVAVTR